MNWKQDSLLLSQPWMNSLAVQSGCRWMGCCKQIPALQGRDNSSVSQLGSVSQLSSWACRGTASSWIGFSAPLSQQKGNREEQSKWLSSENPHVCLVFTEQVLWWKVRGRVGAGHEQKGERKAFSLDFRGQQWWKRSKDRTRPEASATAARCRHKWQHLDKISSPPQGWCRIVLEWKMCRRHSRPWRLPFFQNSPTFPSPSLPLF